LLGKHVFSSASHSSSLEKSLQLMLVHLICKEKNNLFGCETASVKAVGSWWRQVDVGAPGNVHDKKNYFKKCRHVRPMTNIYTKLLRKSIAAITQS
jgi:hypothetical protein